VLFTGLRIHFKVKLWFIKCCFFEQRRIKAVQSQQLKLSGMQPVIKLFLFLTTICFFACDPDSKHAVASGSELPKAPKQTEDIFKKAFPGAMPGSGFSDSVVNYILRKYKITPDKMLLGASLCVDDIIYTKNFRLHAKVKGPFNLGGLAGLPFTGVSGLGAFAHHIPDDGVMLLLIAPHIGYSESKGWGYVLRHEQHHASTCCGALMGTLGKLQNGTLKPEIKEEDYQGGKIAQLALGHQKEILGAENPVIELTKITAKQAEQEIRSYIPDVDMEHIKYVILVTGIMINTDYAYSDYLSVNHFMVYDVAKKAIVEDVPNPFKAGQ
jgi:hypothetical protein